jgi:hypothetical protein
MLAVQIERKRKLLGPPVKTDGAHVIDGVLSVEVISVQSVKVFMEREEVRR